MSSAADGKKPGTCTTDAPEDIPIECFKDGRRIIRSIPEAYEAFWSAEFSWLLPFDWYRYDIEGIMKRESVYKVVHRSSRLLALFLHTRGHRALALDNLQTLDPRSEYISREAFYARMARLNSSLYGELPLELRPFDFIETYPEGLVPVPGYRLSPDRTVILVKGVDPASGFDDGDVDWALFQVPPTGFVEGGPKPKK